MSNKILEDTIEILTKQMIKDNFQSKGDKEEKYILTKQELYKFSIRLIKVINRIVE